MADIETNSSQGRPTRPAIGGMSRRSLCIGAGGAVALLALGGLKAVPAEARVRPPGNQSEEHILSACIRCGRCIEACPRGVLRPARLEEGILGVRMPVATFDDDWCDFCEEENGSQPKCVAACTSGALTLPPDANADNTVLGKAVIIHDWCIAWAGESTCRHCYKACHHLHDAIILKGGKHPEVDRDLCVGCGACQTACISLGYRAVDPNATSRAIIVVAASEAEELAKKVEYMQSDNQPADDTSPEKQSFDDAQRDGRSGNGNHGGQGDKKRGGM